MNSKDLLAILEALDGAQVEIWLDGGWGVDALLGEQTRPHADLDLEVSLVDVPKLCAVLAQRGIHHLRGELHSNFVLGDGKGLEVDVHPVRFDRNGDGIYRMENGEDWVFPAEAFNGLGRIGSRTVRCLSADVQMLDHATGYEPGPTDFHDMWLLHDRLGTKLLPPYDGPRSATAGRPDA